jgi:hypothetical protein
LVKRYRSPVLLLLAVALATVACGPEHGNPGSPSPYVSQGVSQSEATSATYEGGGLGDPEYAVTFPPRNEPFDFRQQLEQLYRDVLRRTPIQTAVDIEGENVWTTEYIRYRVNACGHGDATQRVLSQVATGSVAPVCGTPPSGAVAFPPRNEPFDFRNQLEAYYANVLGRPRGPSFVDNEGANVWTTEYLRYRLNGCAHADSVSKVFTQIQGGGIQPVCATNQSNLDVSFRPNPAPGSQTACDFSPTTPTWRIELVIRETQGVAFTIQSFTTNFFDADGNLINSFPETETVRIPARGSVSFITCLHLGGRTSGFLSVAVGGRDDRRNQLTFSSTRLRLLPVAGVSPSNSAPSLPQARSVLRSVREGE